MAHFIGRIAVQYEFAQKRMAQLGSFWSLVTGAIPEEHSPELLLYRFTFATYSVEAENAKECRDILQIAFQSAFESENGLSEVLVAELDRDQVQADLIKAVFQNFYGVDDYVRLISELYAAFPVLQEKKATDILMRQNYLFAIDGGNGFSALLSSLGDFFYKMNLFKETGDKVRKSYREILVGKETENGYCSVDDLVDMLNESMGEENPYGIIGLDISYYLEGNKLDELRKMIQRLSWYQDDFVFAFRIPFLEKKAFDEIKNALSDVMMLRTVQIPPLHDCVLMENVWNFLNEKNYSPDISLIDLVLKKFYQEKMDGRFYGFQTVRKIVGEIIMKKNADYIAKISAGLEADSDIVTADDVADLLDRDVKEKTGYAALEEMIGMEEIAGKVREIIAQVKVAISNEKLDRPCIHMRFTGAPGTGKTTVARVIGQIMREEGILRKGGFFEYTGRDLVAEYVGQTAVKTATICRDSYGSVLFIDEAYALYDDDSKTNDFGKEALTTLISEMENHRDDMLVVMAGYTDEMNVLMTANPGLRSRMPRILHFPNYTKDQLFQIFMLMVRKHFQFSPDLEEEARKYFSGLSQEYMDSKEFANARFVRNLYERTWSKAALRSSLEGKTQIFLKKEDFIAASNEKEFSEKIEKKKVLGF